MGGDGDGSVSGREFSTLPETLMDDLADRLTAAEAVSGGLGVGDDDVSSTLTVDSLQYTQAYAQPAHSSKLAATSQLLSGAIKVCV